MSCAVAGKVVVVDGFFVVVEVVVDFSRGTYPRVVDGAFVVVVVVEEATTGVSSYSS